VLEHVAPQHDRATRERACPGRGGAVGAGVARVMGRSPLTGDVVSAHLAGDHVQATPGIDGGDQGDQGADLVVVVALADLGPGVAGDPGAGEPSALVIAARDSPVSVAAVEWAPRPRIVRYRLGSALVPRLVGIRSLGKRFQESVWSSGPGESHPRALTEPCSSDISGYFTRLSPAEVRCGDRS
jgi:hypothetical protein